jgi:hypothetical protein
MKFQYRGVRSGKLPEYKTYENRATYLRFYQFDCRRPSAGHSTNLEHTSTESVCPSSSFQHCDDAKMYTRKWGGWASPFSYHGWNSCQMGAQNNHGEGKFLSDGAKEPYPVSCRIELPHSPASGCAVAALQGRLRTAQQAIRNAQSCAAYMACLTPAMAKSRPRPVDLLAAAGKATLHAHFVW